jgi:hypothetical protein
LYGYWNGGKNQLHVEGWLTSAGNPPSNKEWDLYVVTRKDGRVWMYRNGVAVVNGTNWAHGFDGLFFNVGGCCGGETSDAELAEVALWKVGIGEENIKDITTYLTKKWGLNKEEAVEPNIYNVEKAYYGESPTGRGVNVTKKVVQYIKDNKPGINADNGIFGDPVGGVYKRLYVTYSPKGSKSKKMKNVGEGQFFNFDLLKEAESFTIKNNNNLVLWFDANDTTGNGSTTGSTLSTWVDKSNGKHNLTAKAEPPVIIQNGIAGKPTILFENNKHFDGTVNINGNKLSIYSVIKTRNGGGFAERIIGFSDAPGNNDYNSGAYMGLLRQNGDAYGPYRGGVFNSNTIPRKVPTILSAWYDGQKQYSSVNGAMNYKENNSGGNFNIKVFSVGKQTNMGDYGPARYDGEIAEILVFNDKLSKENHMQVEGYLAHKWNLQSYLPNDHAYKNSKPNVSV